MRIYRSTPEEEGEEVAGNVTITLNQNEGEQDEADREVIRNILTNYVYYILLGAFILIFIGIYCVCR